MPKKRYRPEEIVAKLRQVDVLVSQGQNVADAIRQIGVSEVAYYRWRQEYGGLKTEQGEASEGARAGEHPSSQGDLRPDARQAHSAGSCPGKLLSPARRRACIEQIRAVMEVSERRVCAALGQHRSTQRKVPRGRKDEEQLTADIVEFARQYGRYGYRKIAGLLEQAGWLVNDKRVERIWRREGLKVPPKQPKRRRLWLADGSCIRLRPEHRDHVWSYDFVEDRTHDGREYRMLNVIDEFTHECLAIRVARKLKAIDVIDVLSDLFILRGIPGHIRSDNGPEFVAKAVREWITAVGARRPISSQAVHGKTATSRASTRAYAMNCSMAKSSTRCVRPRSSSKVGGVTSIQSARIESLGYKPPEPDVFVPAFAAWPAALRRPAPAGHITAGATANVKLTFHLGHPMGSDHSTLKVVGLDKRVPRGPF